MIRVVLDTNEYVSALIRTTSLPAKILRAWYNEQIQLVTSPLIREEIERVLHYPRIQEKYHLTDSEIQAFLRSLIEDTLSTADKITVDAVKDDPEDNKFLACAIEGGADYIVSGDRHLLQFQSYQGIRILTPRSFLQELEKEIYE